MSPLKIRWQIHPLSSFVAHASTWDEVNAAAGCLPFLESLFLAPLIHHYPEKSGLLVFGYTDSGPMTAALLYPTGYGRITTFQPSQLPLGAWLVARGVNATDVANSLLKALPIHCLALGISQQDPLLWPRPVDSPRLRALDYITTGWIEVSGSFEKFWDARGKNLRNNLRKQRNKFASENVEIQFERLTGVKDAAGAVAEFGRLESLGWKAEIGTAVSADTSQGRFYTAVMEAFCAAGRGEVWQLRISNKVVAVDLCVAAGGTLVILKTAYDPEYRTASPAFLLKQDAFKQIFEEGKIQRIEFYGRLMEWHTRWTEESRILFHANIFRWNWVAHLRDRSVRKATSDLSQELTL